MKTCYTCKQSKSIKAFSKHNQKKDGLDPNCKACRNKKAKKYYQNSPALKIKSTKDNHKICSKCSIEKSLEEYSKRKKAMDGRKSACKKCLKSAGKNYYQQNLKKESKRKKIYYNKNKKKIIEKTSNYNINRRKIDHMFKLKHNLRKRLRSILLQKRWNKNNTFSKYIGCSLIQLKRHIENQFKIGMKWENYGEWEIDHIVPLSVAQNQIELYELCHYSNLQPLWISENRKKYNKI